MLNTRMSQEWIKAALIDLDVIKAIVADDNLTTITAFHSQQSIEKCLKALLELNNQEVPKVHNIKKLLNLTKEYIHLEVDVNLIIKIDTLYIESRYPGDMGLLPYGKPTSRDAQEFYSVAQYIFEKVSDMVKHNEK